MHGQSITHDSNEFRMDFILVLLIVLSSTPISPRKTGREVQVRTYPLQLVKFDQNDRLLGVKMPTERFPDVGH